MTNQEILHAYGTGTTDQWRNVIVKQSADFVVIRTPGHTDWSGVGSRDYYPTHTVIIRKGEWCLHGEREEWYGRVSKKILTERLAAVQQAGTIVHTLHQDKDSTRLL
jgi:thymidylate synthase